MRARFKQITICMVVLTCCGYAQMPIKINVVNRQSASVSITPLDPAHLRTIPKELVPFMPRLPGGSFLLLNQTHVPITAVVALWSFTRSTGAVEKRQIQCDGYIFPPVRPIVMPNDRALITPGSCTKGELFARFGSPSFGSPLASDINSKLLASQADIEKIDITVDSVIFADGAIVGPDDQKYYTKIWDRHVVAESFVKEVNDAVAQGEDIQAHAKRIRESEATKNDKASALRGNYAALLARSPNPAATLAQLQSREALPEFHHIEGGR
jgi:hypothetical protein